MITFKQYLDSEGSILEAMIKPWFTKKVDPEMAINFLNQHAKAGLTAIKNGGLVYRGFSKAISGDSYGAPKSFVAVDSSTGERTSRDTDNAYQICMDYSPAMAGWPKRGKSFICSSSKSTADGYGDPYVMVPLDGTKIAVAPVGDIFRMQIHGPISDSPDDLSAPFNYFFKSLGAKQQKGDWNDPKELNGALSKFSPEYLAVLWDKAVYDGTMEFKDKNIEDDFEYLSLSYGEGLTGKNKERMTRIADYVKKHGLPKCDKKTVEMHNVFKNANPKERFFALAGAIMSPKTTGCKLVTYGDPLPKDNELWFSGKAMAIPFKDFADMLVTLEKQKFPINKSVLTYWAYAMKEARKHQEAHTKTVAKTKVNLDTSRDDEDEEDSYTDSKTGKKIKL